ncbi:polysaccharide deacetylase family protein [Alphaproteobacteria bacterium]|nr:polysaccharide deacetylase family protein [Alphaproteobacteria bacterium]
MSEQLGRYRDGPGYDHDLYGWSPMPGRKPFPWPDGARIALAAFVHVEDFELEPPEGSVADPRFGGALGSYPPDFQNYTRRLYGLRVGYYRVLEVLERHGIHATVCFNAFAAERHPQLVERALRGGHGLAARGLTSRQIISSEMSEDDERAYIQQTLDTLEQAAGRRMLGWAGQDMGESTATPRLLHEAGLTHVIDWPNDDQPYPMPVAGPDASPLVSLPNQTEWDDAELFSVRHVDPWRYPEIFSSAFDQLHLEGGQMMGFGIHPWIFGQAFRIRYLDEALARVGDKPGVWRATSDEIAEWSLSNWR